MASLRHPIMAEGSPHGSGMRAWPHRSLQLVHLCLEHQVNRCMGCDYNIELSIRLDKSVNGLDAIDAERPYSVKILSHAAVSASTAAALLAYAYNAETRPQWAGAPRTANSPHPWTCNLRSPASRWRRPAR
jgi:hypothetical protein